MAVGIVIPYDDTKLRSIHIDDQGTGTANASPYVIAMQNMGITILPHTINALLCTSIYSAGNTYTYCAARSLYSLALEGHAPAFLKRVKKSGIPINCFAVTMAFPFLAFLQANSGSAKVLSTLISVIAGGCLVNYIVILITFLSYHKGCKAQGVDRRSGPYYGYLQPYGAWVALVLEIAIAFSYGYTAFRPCNTSDVFANYTMQLLAPVLYTGWKLAKKTQITKAHEVDLQWARSSIDRYEAEALVKDPPSSFWGEMASLIGFGKNNL